MMRMDKKSKEEIEREWNLKRFEDEMERKMLKEIEDDVEDPSEESDEEIPLKYFIGVGVLCFVMLFFGFLIGKMM